MRNLSARGARLAFGDATAVPNAFELEITGEGLNRSAVVRWRAPMAIGVEFVKPETSAGQVRRRNASAASAQFP